MREINLNKEELIQKKHFEEIGKLNNIIKALEEKFKNTLRVNFNLK